MIEVTQISGLTSEQAREYNRAQALALCLSEEAKIYTLYQPFDAEAKLFSDNHEKLIALVPGRDSNGVTITKGKDSLKTLVAVSANIICTRTAAYAIKISDKDLQAAIYHSTSSIQKLKDADVLSFATRLADIVSPLLTKEDFMPYAITAGMLAELTANAASFNNTIGKASFADSKKSYVSGEIDAVLKAIRDNVVQFNLLLNFFGDKYPAFVKSFRTAVAIDYSGVHHSGIKGTVINSTTEQPVNKVTVTLQGKKKSKMITTGLDGAYHIVTFQPGKARLAITVPGYESQVIEVIIIRGKTIDMNISLIAQVISLSATA